MGLPQGFYPSARKVPASKPYPGPLCFFSKNPHAPQGPKQVRPGAQAAWAEKEQEEAGGGAQENRGWGGGSETWEADGEDKIRAMQVSAPGKPDLKKKILVGRGRKGWSLFPFPGEVLAHWYLKLRECARQLLPKNQSKNHC